MGTWGIGPFENDAAADWLYDLSESSDLLVINAAFDLINEDTGNYLDAMDCSNALAAAEIVAALLGRPLANLPQSAKDWVTSHATVDAHSLAPKAEAAVQSIRTNSELKELWDDTDDAVAWNLTLDDLSTRLRG